MKPLYFSFWIAILLQAVGQSPLSVPLNPASLTILPTNVTVRLGESVGFWGHIVNAPNQTSIWTVNGVVGGNTNIGTITNGLYWAPLVPVAGNSVIIGAFIQAIPTASGAATVQLQNPFPLISSVSPMPIPFGTRTLTINGSGFVPDTSIHGDLTNIYTATYISPTQMTVTGYFPPTMTRFTRFFASNPNPYWSQSLPNAVPTTSPGTNMSFLKACRLMEQVAWGPDATNVDHLQRVGFAHWWLEQLFAPPSTYVGPGNPLIGLSSIQDQFVSNALTSSDQLRQRLAFALSSFIVVSGNKVAPSDWYAPYMNVLSEDALGTYAQLLTDITLCPTMAFYLDMADNDKAMASRGTVPNENYARELMQLFTVGTVLLNLDGTPKLATNGLPIPTYAPAMIPEMARVFTGWTYPGIPDPTTGHAIRDFSAPMQPVEANHDTGPKTIIGNLTLPGGQSARADLDATIQALVQHPNTAPFVATRLIQRLVNGNPSRAYVTRVASVFLQTGGRLNPVVWAILADPEARRGDFMTNQPPSWSGHLREPTLYTLAILRSTGTMPVDGWYLDRWTSAMGEDMENPASVFGFFSPTDTTDAGLLAPEFRLMSEPSALKRINFVNNLVIPGPTNIAAFNYYPFINANSSPDNLLAAFNNNFYYGRMSTNLMTVIRGSIASATNQLQAICNGLYLSLTDNSYQVQY